MRRNSHSVVFHIYLSHLRSINLLAISEGSGTRNQEKNAVLTSSLIYRSAERASNFRARTSIKRVLSRVIDIHTLITHAKHAYDDDSMMPIDAYKR
ncbi:hypothetical protein AB6A40_002805 [Gnathostoma spinigerum]|uniref:Uncharacterized protein n=1 Tax=Gnathostoma spinigerum TaxID=75299 RepID=A0ABD6EA68_9BILA